MYNLEEIQTIIDEIGETVQYYVDGYSYQKDDMIVIYFENYSPRYEIIHSGQIILDYGKSVVCPLSSLVSKGRHKAPEYRKITDFLYSLIQIPNKVINEAIRIATRLANSIDENNYNLFFGGSIEYNHTGEDGTQCFLYKADIGEYEDKMILLLNDNIRTYQYIKPYYFHKEKIPFQVVDFLYPNTKHYTHIRYVVMYKGEILCYANHRYGFYDDFDVEYYDAVIAYNPITNKCRYLSDDEKARFAHLIYDYD